MKPGRDTLVTRSWAPGPPDAQPFSPPAPSRIGERNMQWKKLERAANKKRCADLVSPEAHTSSTSENALEGPSRDTWANSESIRTPAATR
mmetsp:Transcript_33856/g.93530  ORF Transcript_33856/g.93530 Transcript_33856/m.93530 type:complete len:90 (+) Transcript_33856:198-467(+)